MKKFKYFTAICFWLLNIMLLMLTITGCQPAIIIREYLGTQSNSSLTDEEIAAASTTVSEIEASSKAQTEAVPKTELLPASNDIFNLCVRAIDENTGLPYIADKYAGIDNNKANTLLEMALKRALYVREKYQKDRALENIISVYTKMGDIDKAVKTAE